MRKTELNTPILSWHDHNKSNPGSRETTPKTYAKNFVVKPEKTRESGIDRKLIKIGGD